MEIDSAQGGSTIVQKIRRIGIKPENDKGGGLESFRIKLSDGRPTE